MSGRAAREAARAWLWRHASGERQRACGHDVVGASVTLVRVDGAGRWRGLETCGSVWTCPVCSAKVLAARADELRAAIEAWTAEGGQVVMVTLTMRHGREHELGELWDAQGDAWAAASGRSSAVRRAKTAAGVAGWVRRVEATWGARHGWHVHVHSLLFVSADTNAKRVRELGAAMFGAWAARLARKGLTPLRDKGGLDVKVLELGQAQAAVADYTAKGVYAVDGVDAAALEIAGGGKLGRNGNVTPWQVLDRARAGDGQALALWREWEAASKGRRAITWSQGIRDQLGLGDELADDELAADPPPDVEPVASWDAGAWAAIRDAGAAVALLELVEVVDELEDARQAVADFCTVRGLPAPWWPEE